MRIALAQTDIAWNAPENNVAACRPFADRARDAGVRLLIFPEMFTTGFSFAIGDAAREAHRIGVDFLAETARTQAMFVAGSLPELRADSERPFNTLFVFGPDGGCIGTYAKMHLANPLGEGVAYRSGDTPLTVPIDDFQVSFFICYDLRFGNAFAARTDQTDLYVVTANWPSPRHMHWETLLAARAIENQAFVAGVNRVGSGGGLDYLGGSRIVSPKGEILAQAGREPDLLIADLERAAVSSWRDEFPWLADRRAL